MIVKFLGEQLVEYVENSRVLLENVWPFRVHPYTSGFVQQVDISDDIDS